MERCILILGGNIGDASAAIDRACGIIEERMGHIAARSGKFTSKAWGFDAPDFVNEAVEITTPLTAEELLDRIHAAEAALGRDREAEAEARRRDGERYHSRTMDIDILFYGSHRIDTPRLRIPHPLMAEREFVLAPLERLTGTRDIQRIKESLG